MTTEREVIVYSSFHGGCGYGKGQIVGRFYPLGFVLAYSLKPAEEIERFTLLPDDYILKGDKGEIISVGMLRKSLRKLNVHPFGIESNFIGSSGTIQLFPYSCEEVAMGTLHRFFELHPISDYHNISNLTQIEIVDDKTLYNGARILHYKVQLCQYRTTFAICSVQMEYSRKFGWWYASYLTVRVGDKKRTYFTNGARGDKFELENPRASHITIPVDPKPQRKEGPYQHGYYGVSTVRKYGQLIGTYSPRDIPQKLHPRIMPEIPEGYELLMIRRDCGSEVAPLVSEPQEFENHVIVVKQAVGEARIELYLLEANKLELCPNEGAVKI